jgi:dTDP-4-amino-4,6-dideoxygalactose transaminase
MTWRLPVANLVLTEEDVVAVSSCLSDGWLTMGPRTSAFESAVAEWTTASHAVAVSSGSAALHLACRALELGPEDEVIVPAMTFVATAHAPRYVGARPVLCDVLSADEPNIDVSDVERRMTRRTRAVIAVHWWGYPAGVDALRELCDARGVALVEDCAQAIGARLEGSGRQVGTIGRIAALSFFSKKQLSVGEGGMVLTSEAMLAERIRLLRSHAMTSTTWDRHHGYDQSYDIVDVGYNFRIDEPRAALGLSRLPRLAADLAHRRGAVRAYRERLSGTEGVTLMWSDAQVERASHFAFGVLFESREARDRVRATLADRGIQTTRYPALHELTEYAAAAAPGSLPRAEEAANRHLVLPLSSHIRGEDIDLVAETVRRALQRHA